MISIGKLVDAEQAVRYLVESTTDAQMEYYVTRDEAPGRWTGRAAEQLGLDGTVTREQLRSLLNGRDPYTGADLMERRWSRQSVIAYDVTFSAPKSVSLLWAVGDERTRAAVLRAHQTAVDAVCEYLQAHAGWGRRYDRESEETIPVRAQLVMPQFLHRTSRPVTDPDTGVITVDPQLHTHIPIPNYVPPLCDERGTHLHEERPAELAERLERQWDRSEARDSTLDYERFDEAVERRGVQRERELSDVLGRLEDRTPRRVPAMSIDDDPFDHDEAIDHDPFQYSEVLSPDIGGPSPF